MPLIALALALGLALAGPGTAGAVATGKIQGRILGTDTGEPIGFADVLLIPADTTMRKVGGLTNADGTYLLEAAAGRYDLQIRALSYAPKRVPGLVLVAGQVLPFDTGLQPQAIQQKEIVVEARARTNTDNSMLQARKRSDTVGDAVSAEQVRRSPDRNAADVLRRVTGLNVSDGKYVFVRGLGERYSSTEIDGVRVASPEQNKRVVPLDLLPANLIDNIVVQKTYSADRAGEFGGGDVQVHTKDFPGAQSLAFSVSQTDVSKLTFHNRTTYHGSGLDVWGFGASDRGIPQAILDFGTGTPLRNGSAPYGFPKKTLAGLANAFADTWSPTEQHTVPNGSYSLSYGDEHKLFGRSLGIIASSSLSRSFSQRTNEVDRLFYNGSTVPVYDYNVNRSTASAQLGSMGALSYRLSPSHSVHLRGLFSNTADDEVRTYQGTDNNRDVVGDEHIIHRDTRLMYVQRQIKSGMLEGRDEFQALAGLGLDWRLSRSAAKREQPDTREYIYEHGQEQTPDGGWQDYWALSSAGRRDFGDLHDDGWGSAVSASLPYRLGGLGRGKLSAGYQRDTKLRLNEYRRFEIMTGTGAYDPTAPPESIFTTTGALNGKAGTGYLYEGTLEGDNYVAHSRVEAGYTSLELPVGPRVRTTFGIRRENGYQDVASHDLWDPTRLGPHSSFASVDWLPSANLTWSPLDALNLRLAASRTLSRPDLDELSTSPFYEFVAGYGKAGNPDLHRSRIENYDARIEAFPTPSEVFAVGYFYKHLQWPIEQTLLSSNSGPLLMPVNADRGINRGVELEARTALGKHWHRLRGLSLNANASVIGSRVVMVPPGTVHSSLVHPLQGQAAYVANASLTYQSRSQRLESTVLFGAVGRRLFVVGYSTPDIYDQPTTSLDATVSFVPLARWRLSLGARNLTDPVTRQLQDGLEWTAYRTGRSYSASVSFGS